jgi:hypothetical protein
MGASPLTALTNGGGDRGSFHPVGRDLPSGILRSWNVTSPSRPRAWEATSDRSMLAEHTAQRAWRLSAGDRG